MATAVHWHPSGNQSSKTVGSYIPTLPNLSLYNNPDDAAADFRRGVRIGRQAALQSPITGSWNLDDETAELDIALDDVPVSESMSFAFLKGFASGFRETYRARFELF